MRGEELEGHGAVWERGWGRAGEAARGGCSLLALQEQQVEQMREGEEEVEENSSLLRVDELRGNGLYASFHLFLLT